MINFKDFMIVIESNSSHDNIDEFKSSDILKKNGKIVIRKYNDFSSIDFITNYKYNGVPIQILNNTTVDSAVEKLNNLKEDYKKLIKGLTKHKKEIEDKIIQKSIAWNCASSCVEPMKDAKLDEITYHSYNRSESDKLIAYFEFWFNSDYNHHNSKFFYGHSMVIEVNIFKNKDITFSISIEG